VIYAIASPSVFLAWANISNILGSQAVLFVLAIAALMPSLSGDFDLSLGGLPRRQGAANEAPCCSAADSAGVGSTQPLSAIAGSNGPAAVGEAMFSQTLAPPADSPKIVGSRTARAGS
jgi:ABC-type xylose transport system permease subunit